MTRRPRPNASRLAAAAVAAGALLIALPGEQTQERSASPSETPQLVPSPAAARKPPADPPPRGTEPPDPRAGAARHARVRRLARRFLRAFLRYQAGAIEAPTRRALRATCTPALARTLLRQPPRMTGSPPPPARLRRLTVIGPFAGELKAVARLAYPGAGESLLELALANGRGPLRVARFYP